MGILSWVFFDPLWTRRLEGAFRLRVAMAVPTIQGFGEVPRSIAPGRSGVHLALFSIRLMRSFFSLLQLNNGQPTLGLVYD